MTDSNSQMPKLLRRAKELSRFFTAQTISIVANSLYGLLCVRLLPSSEYAKFVVVFGVQGTLLILMDANLSGTLIPLIGDRVGDRQLIADYVASLRRLSIWAYGFIGLCTLVAFPLLVRHRGWSAYTVGAMTATLLLSTWFMRLGGCYLPTLIMLGDRRSWYRGQLGSSLGTLALLGIFWLAGWLGPLQAILINVAGIVFACTYYFLRSKQVVGTKGVASPEKQKAIIRLALPNLPQSIFFALQGQISLFLITYLGHSSGIASVGALGRLSQIFALFLQANSVLVEPYFARLPKEKLKKTYALTLAGATLVSGTVMVLALETPHVLLWILGPQYASLDYEVRLAIGAGALSCISGVLWGIHSARRFVYWWNVILSIGLTFLLQALFIWKADMSTVRGVLWLSFATTVASFITNVSSGIYGFIKGSREGERHHAPEPEPLGDVVLLAEANAGGTPAIETALEIAADQRGPTDASLRSE